MAFLTSLLRKREQPGGAVSQLICIVHKTVLNHSCPWTKAPGPVSFAAFVRLIAAVLDRRSSFAIGTAEYGFAQVKSPAVAERGSPDEASFAIGTHLVQWR